MVNSLLHRGCATNVKNKAGETPLHAECKKVRLSPINIIPFDIIVVVVVVVAANVIHFEISQA